MAEDSLSPALRESLVRLEAELARNAALRRELTALERGPLARLAALFVAVRSARRPWKRVAANRRAGVAGILAISLAGVLSAGEIATAATTTAHDVSAACRIHGPLIAGGSIGIDALSRDGSPANIADGSSVVRSAGYDVYGWGSDRAGGRAARGVCLIVDGKVESRATSLYGEPRPDVAKVFQNPLLAASGYLIKIPPGTLPVGVHRIGVAVVSQDGSLAGSTASRTVTVR